MASRLTTQTKKLKLDAACGLTAEHVLNRMGAMTCGGCHKFSNGKDVAPGIKWPTSLGFVQIDEGGNLSNLLQDRFLPSRFALTHKIAGGGPFLAEALVAEDGNAEKLQELRNLLQPSQQQNAAVNSSQVEALSNHLRQVHSKEPGAFVLFRKPD